MRGWRSIFLAWAALILAASPDARGTAKAPQHASRGQFIVAGYWHNWVGKSTEYIPLRDVSPLYTHIFIAFAVPSSPGSPEMAFKPTKQPVEVFKADVRLKQSRGVKVILSVGGGNHPVVLSTPEDAKAFARSLANLVREYGFDGVDINLEGESLHLDPGDTDFRHPTTRRVRMLIEAIRDLDRQIGREKIVTVTPEAQYVVAGYKTYGEKSGGYLPILHALREQIDWVQMQFYNAGTKLAFSGRGEQHDVIVKAGTPDFVVALAEMLILGFPVNRDPNLYFHGLGAEKVVIGLPATPLAGNGYLAPADVRRALRRLMTGERTYRSAYAMRSRRGHPALAGVMTWSVNWDASTHGGTSRYEFARTASQFR
ncbi:MAG: chitinase [Kiritimatiellae bacterium]|nr:chitinase [Kiritimatiellia bacterium]MDW8459166.1 chitinase [Verrucomicrobiota bacterium]